MGTGRSSLRVLLAALAATLAVGASVLFGVPAVGNTAAKPGAVASGEHGEVSRFGFSDDPIPMAEHVAWAQQAHASVGRALVHWWVLENRGWDRSDQAYQALRDNGIRPVMTLSGDRESGDRLHTMGAREWRALVREFAHRYPGAALQILNETNHPGFGTRLEPEVYARKLKQAERAVRSVRPNATVIASASAPRGIYRTPHWGAARYTREVFDNIGPRRRIHAAANIFPANENRPIREARNALRWVRSASGGRPVWVTETALRGHIYGIGPKRARQSARLLRMLRQRGARAVIFHRLIDTPMRPGVMDTQGALDARGRPTSLYWALQRAASPG
jgi:hypothetical protein